MSEFSVDALHPRMRARVDASSPSGCWLWTGALTNGMGRIRLGQPRKQHYAHRAVYEWLVGPIPDGLVLDHYRMNPGPRNAPCATHCVNPAHLEVVTRQENTRRGRSGMRQRSRTHCANGHPYSAENTYVSPEGERSCRICMRAHHRRYYYRDVERAREKAREQYHADVEHSRALARARYWAAKDATDQERGDVVPCGKRRGK